MNKYVQQSIFFAVVDDRMASKVIEEARKVGITGGTIFYATFHQDNSMLCLFGLECVRKEIFMSIVPKELESKLYANLGQKFRLDQQYGRFAFSADVEQCFGIIDRQAEHPLNKIETEENMEEKKEKYKAIYVIVDKHVGDEVIALAKKKGARGATVIHGRGAGVKMHDSIFDLVIEPQKEVVLFLVKEEMVEGIVEFLREQLQIDSPNRGIIFVMDINNVYGLA